MRGARVTAALGVRVLSPPACVLVVRAAAEVEGVTAALPFLDVIRGPLGVVLFVLAVGVGLARAGAGRGRAIAAIAVALPSAALALVAALVYVWMGLSYSARLGVSGDEPHYLLMAQSLWRDHDLDLENNVAAGHWEEFTPRAFVPHYGAPRHDGRPFPAHSPGLPALLAPAYALGGRRACVVLMALMAGSLVGLVHALAGRLTGDRAAALWAWAAAAGPPLAAYSFHLYTETPSALALTGSFLLLVGPASVPSAVVAALLASALPWLHVKMIAAATAIGLLALTRLRGRPLAAFVTVAGLMAAVFLGYYQWVFGRATPLALYGGVPSDFQATPLRAAAGLLLDRSFGLLPHAPLFLLALAGLDPAGEGRRRDRVALAGIALAVVAPVLAWRMWWGGQCPPGRFLVPLVPVLAVGVAAGVRASRSGLGRWRRALLGLGLALTVFAVATPEARLLLNRGNRPTRVWAVLSADVPVGRYLPSLTLPEPAEHRVACAWIAALAVLFACDRLSRRRPRMSNWFGGLVLPLGLLVGIGTAVDFWARPREEGTAVLRGIPAEGLAPGR